MASAPKALVSTKGMDRVGWLTARRSGIGGSDARVILGHDPHRGWLSLYLEKVTTEEALDPAPSECATWGRHLENAVAVEFAERSGFRVINRFALLQHPQIPYVLATIDREVFEKKGADRTFFEIKTTSAWNGKNWDDAPPNYVLDQVQHYLSIYPKATYAWVACLIGGQQMVVHKVKKDDRFISDLLALEEKFWWHVTNRVPPAPTIGDVDGPVFEQYLAMRPADENSVVELSPEGYQAFIKVKDLRTQATQIGKDKKIAEAELKLVLGSAVMATVGGETVVKWSESSRQAIDTKRLKQERPDIASEYTKESTSRRLTIVGAPDDSE